MKIRLILLLFCCSISFVFAQKKVTLNGYMKDANSGENLIGAVIKIPAFNLSSYANKYGFYSISIPQGEYAVEISYVGFNTLNDSLQIQEKQQKTFELFASE